MKKIIIILLAIIGWSPSVKSLVCVEGDCYKMGYTINVDDTVPYCEAYIRCPYNTNLKTCARYNAYPLSECPEGGECSQSPKYRLASAEESIKFKVKAHGTSGSNVRRFVIISMDTNGDYSIDWGDEGSGDDCSDIAYTAKTNEICHGYSELGKEYTITISGNVTSFKLIYDPTETLYEDADGTTYHYADLKSIENLNLPSLKTLDGAFAGLLGNDDFGNPIYSGISTLSGTIPTMAGLTNLTSASNMFAGNTGELQLADNFTLPSNLKNASDMFNGCTNLTGTIKKLPDSLTQVSDMFSNTALSASCLYKPEGVTTAQGSIAQNSPNINLYSDWKNYADECDYTVAGNNTLCHCLPSTGCMEGFKAAYKTDDLKTYCSGERGGGYWAWHPYNDTMSAGSSCAYGTAVPDWGYTCPDGSDPTTEADVFGECEYCGDLNSITPMEPKDEYYCFQCRETGWGSADDGATEQACNNAIAEAGVLLTTSGVVEDGVTYYIKQDTNIEYFDVSNGSTVIKPAYELSECKNDDGVTENPTLHIEEVRATDDTTDWQVYVPITIEKVYIGSYFPDFSFYRDVTINLMEVDNCQITDEFQTEATELNFEDDPDFNATTYNRTINVACHKNCTHEDSIGICLISVYNMSQNTIPQIDDITTDKYSEEEQGELIINRL